jgi:hypothetical protein
MNEQERLFDPSRWSPLRMSVWIAVERSSARTLAIASALGRGIRTDSTFAPLRNGKDVLGVYVGPKQRATILAVDETSARTWRWLVQDWEGRHIAHRCGRGAVTLLIDRLQTPCPNPACNVDIPDARSLAEREKRQPTTAGAAAHYRSSGSSLPQIVPNPGDATRDERGDAVLKLEEDLALPVSPEGGEVLNRAENVCACGHGVTQHFTGGRCRRPSCTCAGPRIASWGRS